MSAVYKMSYIHVYGIIVHIYISEVYQCSTLVCQLITRRNLGHNVHRLYSFFDSARYVTSMHYVNAPMHA